VIALDEPSVLTAWAEGLAEALVYAPAARELLTEPRTGSAWRQELELPERSPRVDQAIECMAHALREATRRGREPTLDRLLATNPCARPGEQPLERLARRVLVSVLEQRLTRLPPDETAMGPTPANPTPNRIEKHLGGLIHELL
jgi:hypothetical protein